ncbi:glutathione S-transferase family protein [Gallaecimonas pentaromativorans]|uniref:Glutathione S-transferase n=1 Tax=Gallaecimonas pentaromativorans TaxID=584787 RepID=A0A3N1PLS5_9GAMM|nr:glutathione S-transferase family protein [Gallaecimonas pentaromativorans]ROQ29645.1 glutathione S-transferase [Gallaecimonas pentaromativorans]
MYQLYIANKNYSSWSLRPWLLAKALDIGFEERLVPFEDGSSFEAFRHFSPTGKVPCLVDGDITVWDSLAITEYLAERHSGVWPADARARAFARSACSEMHSGFSALRNLCGMNCGIRVKLFAMPAALEADIARIKALWQQGLDSFGGPYLGGSAFSAVDAFFAPVVFRFQTYGIALSGPLADYAARMLALPAMEQWYQAALAETWREPSHEAEAKAAGHWLEDKRACR